MTTYKHIVQVHPVVDGLPNLHKVEIEREFDTKEQGESWSAFYNNLEPELYLPPTFKAVYHGRVNLATGELE